MSDYKTSLLVNKQVPEFIREEYPKFINFLEAYYEFLEEKQGTELNDLTSQAKNLRYLSDVDVSLEDFENNFFNTYLSLVPKDTSVNKDFLIKNILPLYLSKGSEASFKLLFRMLFGQEIEIKYPKDNILRASDGKWEIDNVLRVDKIIKSYYISNGTTKEFPLAISTDSNLIDVYINDVLQINNFYVRKELKKLIFDSAPSSNSNIEIVYKTFDTNLFNNRKIIGNTSGATGIVEKVDLRTISSENYYQFYVKQKTLDGTFTNGEIVLLDVIDGNNKINFKFTTLSDLKSITIIDGGANYNVGDPVIIRGPSTVILPAKALVDNVYTGDIQSVSVVYGGSGFQISNNVRIVGISTETFNASVFNVDASGDVSPNTITFFTDLITDIDIANVTINAADYGFPATNVTENVNTVISDALSSKTLNFLGPITSVNISNSSIISSPSFEVTPASVNGNVRINDLGIMGRIDIISGGSNYNVGEYLIFTNKPGVYSGYGANAQVAAVDVNGAITKLKINSGGSGYHSDYPTVTVSTANGTGANLIVTSIMGDNEQLQAFLQKDQFGNTVKSGQIISIKLVDPGKGYNFLPTIDLTQSGNGLALANAQLQNSYISLPGRWTSTDSLISSDDRKLEGLDYYIDFSYILLSKTEFSKYKSIFKQLIQPAGFKSYAEYIIENQIQANTTNVKVISITSTVSGTVNVNNSIYVVGTNTKFNIANTKGILTIGSKISVGSNVRYVNAIYSNTVLTVNSAFSITSNGENLIVL